MLADMITTVTARDKFMVIASDGVWEFLSNQDVIDIVKKCNGDADKACRSVTSVLLGECCLRRIEDLRSVVSCRVLIHMA